MFSPSFDPAAEGVGPTAGARLATFNANVAVAINALSEHVGRLAGRVVGVELVQRALVNDTKAVLQGIPAQARTEFNAQSLLPLDSPRRGLSGGVGPPGLSGGDLGCH